MHPNPNSVYPNPDLKSIVYVKNVIQNPNIQVGDYTYYSDANDATAFEKHVTHHYDFKGDKLIIGKFCSIGSGIEFIMNGANHVMKGTSTYPFYIMGSDWSKHVPGNDDLPNKGDTIVGNDVWFGQNVTVLPGVKIGDGAIIGANSVVASNVDAYSIVGGNPAKLIRYRFTPKIIKKLEALSWWNKDIEWITKNIDQLMVEDVTEEFLNRILSK